MFQILPIMSDFYEDRHLKDLVVYCDFLLLNCQWLVDVFCGRLSNIHKSILQFVYIKRRSDLPGAAVEFATAMSMILWYIRAFIDLCDTWQEEQRASEQSVHHFVASMLSPFLWHGWQNSYGFIVAIFWKRLKFNRKKHRCFFYY